MDISVFRAVCRELAVRLPGKRIVDMAEGPSGEICITLKGAGNKTELLICPRPDAPRIYLTAAKVCRSKSLTPSVQAIMNRVAGSTVVSVSQTGLERVASFVLERKHRPGGPGAENSVLVYEMTGKKPNLIVVDDEGRVAVAQTYVPMSDDALRPLLPGLKYEPPPLPDKLDPFTLKEADIESILVGSPGLPPDRALFARIGGLSPLLMREAVARAGDKPDAAKLRDAVAEVLGLAVSGPYDPMIIDTPKGPVLAAFGLAQFAGMPSEKFAGMSEAAEQYYTRAAKHRKFEEAKRAIARDIAKRLDTARRRRAALVKDLARTENAQMYTRYGNLIMAQLRDVPEGASEARLGDLYSEEGGEIAVPLEPRLSPVKNAERYFNLARKAVSGERLVRKRLEGTQAELDGLERAAIDIARARTLEELSIMGGAPKEQSAKRAKPGRQKGALPDFPSFTTADGYEVLYSKNAKTNDLLTFKLAEPMDLWLHAQGYHGAHVIVRNPERRPDIPLGTILEAAAVAAYFSDARKDSSVAVDYTFRKYVRKPRDPVPGQAIFTQNKTVFVNPVKPRARD